MSKEAPRERFYNAAARQPLQQLELARMAAGEGRWQVYDWLVRQELAEPVEALRDAGEDEAANWLTLLERDAAADAPERIGEGARAQPHPWRSSAALGGMKPSSVKSPRPDWQRRYSVIECVAIAMDSGPAAAAGSSRSGRTARRGRRCRPSAGVSGSEQHKPPLSGPDIQPERHRDAGARAGRCDRTDRGYGWRRADAPSTPGACRATR